MDVSTGPRHLRARAQLPGYEGLSFSIYHFSFVISFSHIDFDYDGKFYLWLISREDCYERRDSEPEQSLQKEEHKTPEP
jgi:hypothetical protein